MHSAKNKKSFLLLFLLVTWEEPIAQPQILTVKVKVKYEFSHEYIILYIEKLRNFAYFLKVCYHTTLFLGPISSGATVNCT